MRPGLLLLLLLGACSPPRPAPATAAPAGTPADTHGPRPRAAPQMAPAAACAARPDPEGWFSLGDPALPPRSVLRATPSTMALGFDETGAPTAAALEQDGALVVATVHEGALRLEHPSPQNKGNLIKLALGAEPEGAIVAATTDQGKLLVLRRRSGAWQDRTAAVFCMGTRWDLEFGARGEWPELTVDGAGRVWSACIVRSYGRTGSGTIKVFPSNPTVRETRLRLGRLEGTRWLEVGAGSVLPSTAQGLVLATSPAGDVLVRIGSSDQKTFWSGVVPLREAGRGARTGPLSLVATSGSGAWFGGQGTGWLQFATDAQTCTGASPCRLTAPDATLPLAGYPLAVARRGEVWFAAWASGPGLVSLSQYDRTLGLRPLVASAAGGVSATAGLSIDPAIAVDACGHPTVFWSEDGQRMGRTFAEGQWRTLPSVPGPGPHGLLAGAGGEVYVGAWEPRDGTWQYTVSRVMAGAVTPLPPLRLGASEWTVVDAGRTRLSFDGALHAAFPLRDNALAGARRVGYVLRGAVWKEEPVPASLVEAPAMPWTTSATAEQSALAIDERGRRIVVWSKGDVLGVAQWKGSSWTPLPGGDVSAVAVQGAPAIAAEGGRVCVAWGAPSGSGSDIFVRCHRGEP